MAKIYYQEDCNLNLLKGKKIAVIGYGSQGHAHALNLKESGLDVVVGLYKGSKSWAKAEAQGFDVFTAAIIIKKNSAILNPTKASAAIIPTVISPMWSSKLKSLITNP